MRNVYVTNLEDEDQPERKRFIPVPDEWYETFDMQIDADLVQVARVPIGQCPKGAEWSGPFKSATTGYMLWTRPYRYVIAEETTHEVATLFNLDAAAAFDAQDRNGRNE